MNILEFLKAGKSVKITMAEKDGKVNIAVLPLAHEENKIAPLIINTTMENAELDVSMALDGLAELQPEVNNLDSLREQIKSASKNANKAKEKATEPKATDKEKEKTKEKETAPVVEQPKLDKKIQKDIDEAFEKIKSRMDDKGIVDYVVNRLLKSHGADPLAVAYINSKTSTGNQEQPADASEPAVEAPAAITPDSAELF